LRGARSAPRQSRQAKAQRIDEVASLAMTEKKAAFFID
jgi:hypothetical protein